MSLPSSSSPSLRHDRTLLAVLSLSALLFVLVLVEPLGPDNAVLHSIARDWVQFGRTPYIGSWDNNFPGIMMMHALAITLLGTSGVAFRVFDIIIQLAFVGFFYRFLLRWLPRHTAALAAVLYSCYYVAGGTYLFGQQDGYGMMCVLFGTALLSKDAAPSIGRLLASAVVVGLSFLMRPTFLLYPGLLALYLLFTPDLKFAFRRLPSAALFFLASLIPMGVVLGYYASIPGGLDAFYTSTIRFNLDLYTKLAGGSLWVELARTGLLIPLAAYALLLLARKQAHVAITRRDALLYAALIAGGLFIVLLMAKYWRYQFAPFFMALIPLSAIGIEAAVSHVRSELPRHYATIAALVLCSFIYYNPTAPLAFCVGALQGHNPFTAAEYGRRQTSGSGAPEEKQTLAFLEEPARSHSTVEICGFDPYLRLDLDRQCVGPYVTFHSIGFRTDSTESGHFTEYQLRWQRSYIGLLTKGSPDYIVLARRGRFWYIHDIYSDVLSKLDSFSDLFRHYSLRASFGDYEVYGRDEAMNHERN